MTRLSERVFRLVCELSGRFFWGAEAQQSIRNFEEGLRLLPEECLQLLSKFGFYVSADRYPADQKEDAIFQRFIKTRQINWKGQTYLMPIIELINHSPKHQSWGSATTISMLKAYSRMRCLFATPLPTH